MMNDRHRRGLMAFRGAQVDQRIRISRRLKYRNSPWTPEQVVRFRMAVRAASKIIANFGVTMRQAFINFGNALAAAEARRCGHMDKDES